MIEAIDTLQVIEVQNHGIANFERMAIYVHKSCNLAEYCLMLTLPTLEGGPAPVKDHMLWFGQGWVFPGDWIFVYTASGMTTVSDNLTAVVAPGITRPRVINMFWGKGHTIFQNRALTPMLVRIGGTSTIPIPAPALQGLGGLVQ